MQASFYKYQAMGNDMIVIDPATFSTPLTPALVQRLCDRHLGAGADGVCYGPLPGADHPFTMRFFNPDGSVSEKSGNGLRIFARYLWDTGYVRARSFTIAISSGGAATAETIPVQVLDDSAHTIALGMGRLTFYSPEIPVGGPAREVVEETVVIGGTGYKITAVAIGNPHCVIFSEALETVGTAGPLLETAALFPRRTNVQLVRVIDPHTIQIEIWERGAGYTLASGTSSCAAAGAAVKTGRCHSPIEVRMAGGAAQVTIDETWQVTLTGTVAAVYQGVLAASVIEAGGG